MRPAFLAAAARPFLRSTSTAFSISPWDSPRADLQSIIGAPVRSRSCFTIWAVTSIATPPSERDPEPVARGFYFSCKRKGQLGLRLTFPNRRSMSGPLPAVAALSGSGALHLLVGGVGQRAPVLRLHQPLVTQPAGAFEIGIGDARGEEADGADGFV